MPIMSSVRNVPSGPGAHMETIVKIIGSKYVSFTVENPTIKAKDGMKVETQSALWKLPACNTRQTHGNPPGLNNPLCQQINSDLAYERRSTDKQEEHKSKQVQTSKSRLLDGKVLKPPNNIHCVSVPSGDQSLFYIHARQKPSLRAWSSRQHIGHDQVNSEKLLKFLRLTEMQNIKTCDLGLQAKSRTLKDQSKSSLALEDPFQILTQILKEYKGELNMDKLSLSFQKEDKSFSGLLSLYEMETICQKHRLTLTPLLLEALLNSCDSCKHGKIRWKKFVQLLRKAHSATIPNLSVPVGEFKEEIGDAVAAQLENTKEHEILASSTWVQNCPIAEGKERPAIQSSFNPTDSSDSEEHDAWKDRFRKLERALYLCDVKNTGMLEKEKAKRLIHNYNLIYELALSPLKIDQGFRNFCSGENMPLQPVLQYLEEL